MNIALVGPLKSGKTTAANWLVERGYTRIALADPLKDISEQMLNHFIVTHLGYLPDRQDALDNGTPPILLDRQEMQDAKEVFRPFWQWLGTDFRDYLKAPNLWIQIFMGRMKHTLGSIVCDDVRFPHEAVALRGAGFKTIRIIRPEANRLESGTNVAASRHASETLGNQIRADYTIRNDGTLDDFYWRLGELVAEALGIGGSSADWSYSTGSQYSGTGDDTTGNT